MRRTTLVVALALVPVACASGGADRDETRRRLLDIGFDETQATCVVDAVFALDDDVRDELTEGAPDLDDAEEARLEQLLVGCGVGR